MKDVKRKTIEMNFGIGGGVCLSIYLEWYHSALTLAPKLIPTERQQIVLVNRGEVEAARKKAGGCEPAAEAGPT